MLDNMFTWNNMTMIVVSVLAIHAGIKVINKLFERPDKKNSLF
jgi:hypothetical protein